MVKKASMDYNMELMFQISTSANDIGVEYGMEVS